MNEHQTLSLAVLIDDLVKKRAPLNPHLFCSIVAKHSEVTGTVWHFSLPSRSIDMRRRSCAIITLVDLQHESYSVCLGCDARSEPFFAFFDAYAIFSAFVLKMDKSNSCVSASSDADHDVVRATSLHNGKSSFVRTRSHTPPMHGTQHEQRFSRRHSCQAIADARASTLAHHCRAF